MFSRTNRQGVRELVSLTDLGCQVRDLELLLVIGHIVIETDRLITTVYPPCETTQGEALLNL